MELFIDNHSGVPIYQQIVEQLKGQVLSGKLEPDTPLPSIRNLAKDLRISVITTKRAYEELEQFGLVYTVPGKGCFVSGQSSSALKEAHLREIEGHLQAACRLAKAGGVDGHTLQKMLELSMEESL